MKVIVLALIIVGCNQQPVQPTLAPVDTTASKNDQATEPKAAGKPVVASSAPAEVATVDAGSSDRGIRLLAVGKDLPDCTALDEGLTYYVLEDSEFQACHQGSWAVVDLKGQDGKDGLDGKDGVDGKDGQSIIGPQGVAGEKGADGQSIAGPQGEKGADGQSIVGPQGPQGVAGHDGQSITGPQGNVGPVGAQGQVGPSGAVGPQGPAGAIGSQGQQGVAGSAGSAGAAGKNAAGYYTASDVYLGGAIDSSGTVVLTDGAVTRFNIDGTPTTPWGARIGAALVQANCSFTSSDCSGACYVTFGTNTSMSLTSLVKNTAFYATTGWRKASGAETTSGAKTMHSYADPVDGSCNTSHAAWTAPATFVPASTYTLPTGISLPLGNLYMGAGQ